MYFFLRRLTIILLTLLVCPVLLLLAATLLFFNLVHLVTRFMRQRMPAEGPPLSGSASIIILNWNGRDLLAQGIPSVLEAVSRDGRPHEVIVVDNGSTDGSAEFVKLEFPGVKLVELAENLGFSEGNNAGVFAAKHDVVVLLNNDMVVDPGFLRPLLDSFGPATFAVSSQIFLQDQEARREETGRTVARFRRGLIEYAHRDVDARKLRRPAYPVFWAGGGSSAFHRERYLKLGGLQELYSPAYVEDSDLSYQAWKIGWEVLFAPASIVYHKHRASSRRRFSPVELQALVLRNQFLFIWKNLRSWRLLLSHCGFLPFNCYRLARDHGLGVWRFLPQAIMRLPYVQIAKLGAPFRGVRTDHEIFSLTGNPGRFFAQRGARACAGGGSADPDPRPRVLWLTAYLPHLGRHAGAGRMFQLLRRLSRSYRITLLSFLETEDEREFLPDLKALCENVVAMRRIPPPRWQLYPYEPFDEFRTPGMEAAYLDFLENYDFSLIQLEYTQMGCYSGKEDGIPSVLTKHEVDFAACLRRARVEKPLWVRVRWFYNYLQVLQREISLQRRVSVAICMTDSDARELERFCSSVPIRVINTGVDLDYFRPPEKPATEERMVFVGAFQHLPNIESMLYFSREILPLVRKQAPNAALTIVGSKPTQEILDLADVPGVEVTGFAEDIRPLMSRASVYVVPLRLGVGIRGKILEAWAMGMAVVATSVACAGLRYQDGENLLLADTPERFAECILALFRDPNLRRRLGARGREAAERFYGWDASSEKLDALYRELISGRSPEISPETHCEAKQ